MIFRMSSPSLSNLMDFVPWKDANQQHRWEYVIQTDEAAHKHRQVDDLRIF